MEQPFEEGPNNARPRPNAMIIGISTAKWDELLNEHFVNNKENEDNTDWSYPCSWIIGQRFSRMMRNYRIDYIFPRNTEDTPHRERRKLNGELYNPSSRHTFYDINVPRVIPIWFLPLIVALYSNHYLMLPNNPMEMLAVCQNHLDAIFLQNENLSEVKIKAIQCARAELHKVSGLIMRMEPMDGYFIKSHIKSCHAMIAGNYKQFKSYDYLWKMSHENAKKVVDQGEEIKILKKKVAALEREKERIESEREETLLSKLVAKLDSRYDSRYANKKEFEALEEDCVDKEAFGVVSDFCIELKQTCVDLKKKQKKLSRGESGNKKK